MLSSWIRRLILLQLFTTIAFIGDTAAKKRCKYYGYNLDPGHDITNRPDVAHLEDCCQICLANSQCKGFTHNRGHDCWLKYNDHPLVGDGRDDGWSTSSGIIEDVDEKTLVREAEEESQKSCERLPNTNLDPGHDLRAYSAVSSFEECCNLCKLDTACKGFVHDKFKSCYLKYNDGPTVGDNGGSEPTTGIIRVSAPPPRPAAAPVPIEATPTPTKQEPVATHPASLTFPGAVAPKNGPVCRPFRLRKMGYKEMELYGHNISPGRDITVLHSISTFRRCAQFCVRCNGCMAFVYDPSDSSCYLKDNAELVPEENLNDGRYHGYSIGVITPVESESKP